MQERRMDHFFLFLLSQLITFALPLRSMDGRSFASTITTRRNAFAWSFDDSMSFPFDVSSDSAITCFAEANFLALFLSNSSSFLVWSLTQYPSFILSGEFRI